jgi:hypothetical protein
MPTSLSNHNLKKAINCNVRQRKHYFTIQEEPDYGVQPLYLLWIFCHYQYIRSFSVDERAFEEC